MKCKQCQGTGDCAMCEGLGEVLNAQNRYVPCETCQGTGTCPQCVGYGDLPDQLPPGMRGAR